jgi:sugar phosphate isomerase/epimerase
LRERLREVLTTQLHPEIYFSASALDQIRDDDVIRVGTQLAHHNLTWTFHAPFIDLVPGGIDSKCREATRQRFEHVLRLAALVRPRTIVCHPGYDTWRYGDFYDVWLKNSIEMWRPLVRRAANLNIPLVLENVFEEEPEILSRLLDAVDSPSFSFCFDTGHYNLFGRRPVRDWIEHLGPRIAEVHLHDNTGDRDEHLPPGHGTFDFLEFFRLLRHHDITPIYTLEVHSATQVAQGLESIRRLLNP